MKGATVVPYCGNWDVIVAAVLQNHGRVTVAAGTFHLFGRPQ